MEEHQVSCNALILELGSKGRERVGREQWVDYSQLHYCSEREASLGVHLVAEPTTLEVVAILRKQKEEKIRLLLCDIFVASNCLDVVFAFIPGFVRDISITVSQFEGHRGKNVV